MPAARRTGRALASTDGVEPIEAHREHGAPLRERAQLGRVAEHAPQRRLGLDGLRRGAAVRDVEDRALALVEARRSAAPRCSPGATTSTRITGSSSTGRARAAASRTASAAATL